MNQPPETTDQTAGGLSPADQKHLDHLLALEKVIKAGYAGISKTGQIVDRRIFPDALSIPANPLMGTPEPKTV